MKLKDLKHRTLTKNELQEIDFQFQGGMEFIFWFYDMGDHVTDEKLIRGIHEVLLKVREGLKYPIAEYNSDMEVASMMGFSLGQMLHTSSKWKWFFIEEPEKNIIGYTIVSPDECFGICVEEVFYRNFIQRKEIRFKELGAILLEGKLPKLDKDSFETYQPWNFDYSSVFCSRE